MTDTAGNQATLNVDLTLDSTPPAVPDTNLITFGTLSAGSVAVTGQTASTDPGSNIRLVNMRSGEVVSVPANPDGSFALSIAASAGDRLSLLATDTLGNQTLWNEQTVAGSPAVLAISGVQPADGSLVNNSVADITGTWQGPANTGVIVNGHVATLHGNRFVLTQLPLATGANSIDITVTAPDGSTHTQTISLTGSSALPFELSLDAESGIAPLDVALDVTNNSSNDVQLIEIDLQNDGSIDFTGNSLPPGTSTQFAAIYTTVGLHQGNVRIVDSNSNQYTLPFTMVVDDIIGADAKRRSAYHAMLDRLRAGDIPGAVQAFTPAMQTRYQEIFNRLSANITTLPDRLGVISSNRFGDKYAEITLTRTEPEGERAYTVILVRGVDGVWRIESM